MTMGKYAASGDCKPRTVERADEVGSYAEEEAAKIAKSDFGKIPKSFDRGFG